MDFRNLGNGLVRIKKIMDDKLKCQNKKEHKIEDDTWMVNNTFFSRSDVHRLDNWIICKICNL